MYLRKFVCVVYRSVFVHNVIPFAIRYYSDFLYSVCCSCSLADVPVETEPEVNSVVITTTFSAGCSANTSYLPDAVNISLYHEVLNAWMHYIRTYIHAQHIP